MLTDDELRALPEWETVSASVALIAAAQGKVHVTPTPRHVRDAGRSLGRLRAALLALARRCYELGEQAEQKRQQAAQAAWNHPETGKEVPSE